MCVASSPSPSPAPAPAPIPSKSDQDVQDERRAELRRRRLALGRQNSILTGGEGALGAAPVQTKTLGA